MSDKSRAMQRAMAAARLASLPVGSNQHRNKEGASIEAPSQDQAAARLATLQRGKPGKDNAPIGALSQDQAANYYGGRTTDIGSTSLYGRNTCKICRTRACAT